MSDATHGAVPANSPVLAFARRLFWIAAPFVLIAAVWQIASSFFPPFLFPSLIDVFERVVEIATTWSQFSSVLATALRILAGLAGAFLIGVVLGVAIYTSDIADRLLTPTLTFFQGIPALSWVVFAIIWFHGIEFRILFIMIMTTLPAFTFQVVGALRGMNKDLLEMVMSFRPSRGKYFSAMVLPAVLPEMLTAWKVNLGNASRVVVVAELVGSSGGVGFQLLQQQQLFDMAGALAWTLQLVFFVLLFQWLLSQFERVAFRYRAKSERR
ncbi:ABC transporter permease subunit [Rhodobacterales bacterium HKCCE2091]|nr:ABC transporter permease subunit [Rhodobacterales bacterium HKCCE2091]